MQNVIQQLREQLNEAKEESIKTKQHADEQQNLAQEVLKAVKEQEARIQANRLTDAELLSDLTSKNGKKCNSFDEEFRQAKRFFKNIKRQYLECKEKSENDLTQLNEKVVLREKEIEELKAQIMHYQQKDKLGAENKRLHKEIA